MTLLGAFAGPPAAQAQPVTPQTADAKAAAAAAANQGDALFNAGRYEEALSAFRDADQKFPAPTFKQMIARTYVQLGQLRRAQAVYQEIAAEHLTHYAPQVFFDTQAAAKKELEALSPRIPTLEVQVRGASSLDIELAIDGEPVLLSDPTAMDPGEHTVTATAPGYQTTTQLVDLKEGAAVKVTLEMKALAAPVPSRGILPAVPAQPAGARAPAASGGSNSVVPTILAFTTGSVALIVGVATFDSAEGDRTLETVGTVSLVAGSVLMATGVGLAIWGYSSSQQPTKAALVAGPGWVSVRGSF